MGEAWVNGVYCQRFSRTGALQRLFKMVPTSMEKITAKKVEKAIMPDFEKLRQKIQKRNEETAAKIHEQFRFSGNMWLKRTKWAKHLRGFNRE
jgi:hypothetical protein